MDFIKFLVLSVSMLGLVACKKNYACECFAGQQSLGAKTQKLSKDKAEVWCAENEFETNGIPIQCKLSKTN